MAYVDAEILKRNIRVNLMPNVDIDGTVTVENAERYFLNLIDKTSTADVVEVKHGEWIIETRVIGVEECFRGTCSVCGRTVARRRTKDILELPYCHCGAKMDGRRDA